MAQWKLVQGHPNYEVSSMGMVRNARTGRYLNPYDDGQGYLRVKLDGENCRLHILVAVAFIPNPDNKPIVNHKKGIKYDCRASQLEWVTESENTKHAWDNGLICRGGVNDVKSYKRDELIDEREDVFKAYPPNGRHKRTFGRYEAKDGQKLIILWIDLTEFRKAKGNDSVQTHTVEDGALIVTGIKSKRWLSKFAGVC